MFPDSEDILAGRSFGESEGRLLGTVPKTSHETQASFERATPLDITPRPDVVTRIFMLFQGVKASDAEKWQEAQSRASESPELWKQVVGVEERAANASVFRVVEQGGTDVL